MRTFAPAQDKQAQASSTLPSRSAATAKEAEDIIDRRSQAAQQDALLQMIDASPRVVQQKALAGMATNQTGLPDGLKAGIESLSGMSMDHVSVHYNSAQPAQLNALAYAQGSEIHIGPAQEQHLAHEAWHVVQQAQGRVKPTLQMRGGVQVNDSHDLEHEADLMGAKALQMSMAPGDMPRADPTQGGLSSVQRRPPSSAENMGVDPMYGPMDEKNSSMIEENRFPLTGGILQLDVKIRVSDLQQIAPRSNLRTVMGGSAAGLSNIQSSEWLHAAAHSLGGADQDHNLAAGPHALNTAMIPFETAVKQLVYDGKVVDYSVTFFTEVINDIAYITAVEIGIDVNDKGRKYWTLTVDQSRRDVFINGSVLGEIQGIASSFVSSHMQ